ncbi:M16 family metallopeptidase [Rufibacter quisquiliarum]|uniref:Putative Zn-dependent peptidase n=1 Tax=Rufibacter quisquiliarum TaxID=1549639 RepID=A0A839GFX9_9BACT|nr:pitrilysin family protein [Rufibacter quisquiliarum]MBA9076483.1 putative Zn-dependent peptidase [Rufibacter quisquiliarum]
MALDRSKAPELAEQTPDLSIYPTVLTSSFGTRVHLYPNSIQPIIRLEFVFKAGKWYQDKPGVASLTAKMLKEGTTSHTAKQLADIIDFYGASLEITHGFDRSTLTLYCLSKFLPELLPIVFEILEHPSFPEEEFELLKQRVIQTLAIDKQKNGYLATELFTSSIYGADHPYSTVISEEEIKALTLEDIKAFYKTRYDINSSEVFVTGDFDEEGNNLLKGFLDQTQRNTGLNNVEKQYSKKEATASKKMERSSNTMQAAIRVGRTLPSPEHPDFSLLYLANHALGGYFGSRLMKNIREEKGFTYGIHSSISIKEHGTLLSIGTDIKGDKIEETIREIEKEIEVLQRELLSEEELNTIKKHLAGKFISDNSTIFDKMDRYRSSVLLGLPPNFFTNLQNKMQQASREEVQTVAKEYLSTETLHIVAVGGTQ